MQNFSASVTDLRYHQGLITDMISGRDARYLHLSGADIEDKMMVRFTEETMMRKIDRGHCFETDSLF